MALLINPSRYGSANIEPPPLKTLPFLITIPQPIFFEFFLDRGRKQIIWLQEGRGNV